MPFYTGKTADGSDAKEFRGVYVDPDNPNQWSSEPYTTEDKKAELEETRADRKWYALREYTNGRFTLEDVRAQIFHKECPLSATLRQYVLDHWDKDGVFKWSEGILRSGQMPPR